MVIFEYNFATITSYLMYNNDKLSIFYFIEGKIYIVGSYSLKLLSIIYKVLFMQILYEYYFKILIHSHICKLLLYLFIFDFLNVNFIIHG